MWKSIPGYEGLYSISTEGEVWSSKRNTTSGGLRKQFVDSRGRHRVHLSKDGKMTVIQVSQLMALTFIGPRPDGSLVRHLSDDKSDNSVGNIAYGTSQDNADDAVKNGKTLKGEKHHKAILTAEIVRECRARMKNGEPSRDVARSVGVALPTMQGIKHRHIWKWLED